MISAWVASLADGGAAMMIALAASLGATAFAALAAARRRASAGRRGLVVVLSAGAWIALWLTIVPPRIAVPAGEAVLITPGATASDVASAGALTDVFVLDEALADAALANAVRARAGASAAVLTEIVTLPDDIALHRGPPHRLRIAGAGLTRAQWRASAFAGRVDWLTEPDAATLRDVEWRRRIAPGETARVELRTAGQGTETFALRDPFGSVLAESAPVDGVVTLAARGLPPGRQLLAVVSPGSGESRPLPIEIVRPVPARVLMLQSGPSFEWRALQRWVADSGSPLAVRTRISLERFRYATANRAAAAPELLDAGALAAFDLVVADGREWTALAPAERDAILDGVATGGAGLLLLTREAESANAVNAALGVELLQATGTLTEVGLAGDLFPELPGDLRLQKSAYRLTEGGSVLLTASDGRALAAYTERGAGRVAVSLLLDTHRLVTPGYERQFAALWQSLVGAVARPDDRATFETFPALPTAHWRTRVCVAGGGDPAAIAVRDAIGEFALPLATQRWLPGRRCAWFWPRAEGWHELGAGDARSSLYVFAEDAWRDVRLAGRVDATRRRIAAGAASVTEPGMAARPLPRWWFFPFAVLLAALLWLEQKLAVGGSRVSR